ILASEARRLLDGTGRDPLALCDALNLLGELEWYRADYERSRKWHRRALEVAQGVLAEGHPMVGTTLANLSAAELASGNLEDALRHQLQAMDLTLAARGERHPDTALIFQDLANIYLQQGEYPRALELYERALKDLQLLFGPESNEAANAFYNLGLAWTRMGG